MRFYSLILIELSKLRRSKILLLLLCCAVFLWLPSLFNAGLSFSQAGSGLSPGENFFIQGFLGAAWFMLPAGMVLCTVLMMQTERAGRGMLKMLSLPVSAARLCLAKFIVLLLLCALSSLFYALVYFACAAAASAIWRGNLLLSPLYVLAQSGKLLLFALPMLAFFWMLAVCTETPIFSVGLSLASIVPSVLAMNTKIWFLYPMCYPFYALTVEYDRLLHGVPGWRLEPLPLIPAAILFTAVCLGISCLRFGKNERS